MGRTTRREFAFKQESTPGSAETLAIGDVLVRIEKDVVPDFDIEEVDLNEASATSDQRPILTGRKIISFGVQYVLRAPGDLVTAPVIAPMIESAMFDGAAAMSNLIGAIGSGPFVAGETIDDGGGNTGLVLRETADSAASIPYIPLNGTIGSAASLTGGTSAATATTSAPAIAAGYGFRPADSDFEGGSSLHHGTFRYIQDGIFFEGRGVLSDLNMTFRSGHHCTMEQPFQGAFTGHGDVALFGKTVYAESAITVPRFLDASVRMGTYSPTDIVDFTVALGNGLAVREDANDTAGDGVRFFGYGDKEFSISFDPAYPLHATKNFMQEHLDGTVFSMEFTQGDTAGERWTFSAPQAQLSSVGLGDRDRLATEPLELRLNGDNNNAFLMWQH